MSLTPMQRRAAALWRQSPGGLPPGRDVHIRPLSIDDEQAYSVHAADQQWHRSHAMAKRSLESRERRLP